MRPAPSSHHPRWRLLKVVGVRIVMPSIRGFVRVTVRWMVDEGVLRHQAKHPRGKALVRCLVPQDEPRLALPDTPRLEAGDRDLVMGADHVTGDASDYIVEFNGCELVGSADDQVPSGGMARAKDRS